MVVNIVEVQRLIILYSWAVQDPAATTTIIITGTNDIIRLRRINLAIQTSQV